MAGGTIKTIDEVERIIELAPSFINRGFAEYAAYLKRRYHEEGMAFFLETRFGIGPCINSLGFADFCTHAIEQPRIIRKFKEYFSAGLIPVIEFFMG